MDWGYWISKIFFSRKRRLRSRSTWKASLLWTTDSSRRSSTGSSSKFHLASHDIGNHRHKAIARSGLLLVLHFADILGLWMHQLEKCSSHLPLLHCDLWRLGCGEHETFIKKDHVIEIATMTQKNLLNIKAGKLIPPLTNDFNSRLMASLLHNVVCDQKTNLLNIFAYYHYWHLCSIISAIFLRQESRLDQNLSLPYITSHNTVGNQQEWRQLHLAKSLKTMISGQSFLIAIS